MWVLRFVCRYAEGRNEGEGALLGFLIGPLGVMVGALLPAIAATSARQSHVGSLDNTRNGIKRTTVSILNIIALGIGIGLPIQFLSWWE